MPWVILSVNAERLAKIVAAQAVRGSNHGVATMVSETWKVAI